MSTDPDVGPPGPRRRPGLASILATVAVLVALAVCAPAGERWKRSEPRVDVPGVTTLPLLGERVPLVTGHLDGHPARLLLDTGAESTLLDEGFVTRTGLELVALGNRVTGSRGDRQVHVYEHFARIGTLSLGDAQAHGLRCLVMDMGHIDLALDGIVGMDVLEHWATAFDDEAQEVTILPTGQVGTALSHRFESGATFLNWPWAGDGLRPAVDLAFENGVEFRAVLDTGAVHGSIPESVVEPLQLQPVGTQTNASIAGLEESTVYRLSDLSFGDFTLRNVTVDAEPRSDGLIGYEFLRQLVFVVDGPAREFLFSHEPPRRAPER